MSKRTCAYAKVLSRTHKLSPGDGLELFRVRYGWVSVREI